MPPTIQTYQGVVRKGQIQIKPSIQLPEGSKVYVVVTEDQALQKSALDSLYMNPDRPVMEQEQVAFEAMLPELLAQYKDQYVAVYQGKVVDHDADRVALVMRLDRAYPDAIVLVKQVTTAAERPLQMLSPRLVNQD